MNTGVAMYKRATKKVHVFINLLASATVFFVFMAVCYLPISSHIMFVF